MRTGTHNSTFLPDFCGTRTVFVVLLLAELLAIVLTLTRFPAVTELFYDLALYSLLIQWIALSCVAALCVSRPFLSRLQNTWVALISYLITVLITLLVSEGAWWILHQAQREVYKDAGAHGMFLLRTMGISAIVCALALRYFYIQHQWRLKTRSESEARFQALQSRIRPHFFFNCMNTIATLIGRQPVKAEEAVEDLADLFRASLQDVRRNNSLGDEIKLCEGYLRIEKHRLGERLNITWQLSDLDMEKKIPALTLQPLIENAIIHGIELIPGGGTIQINGERQNHASQITIKNPIPVSPNHERNQGHNLAQENIRQRLKALYNTSEPLKVSSSEEGYQVTITIPDSYEDIDRG